jgi:hypothetical protein
VEGVKTVEITADQKKILGGDNIDYAPATKQENVEFDSKFPRWKTSDVSPPDFPGDFLTTRGDQKVASEPRCGQT